MTMKDQSRAAEVFVAYWAAQRGSEKGEDQTFWNSLLGEVLGVSDIKSRIKYQEPVYFNDGSDVVQIVPNASFYHFGVLMSSVHMAWMRTVCGRLKSDYRYSKEIVYNTFPWPSGGLIETALPSRNVSEASDDSEFVSQIEKTAQAILDVRRKYEGASFAELYGEKMYLFTDLVAARAANDAVVMKAYGFPPDLTEPEIVSRFFEMYAELTKKEP